MASLADLSALLQTTEKRLKHHLYARPTPYRSFSLKKASGGNRTIEIPPDLIKVFQRIIAKHLQEVFDPRKSAHGFARGRSILTNARVHTGQSVVLNLDLEDFFPTIHFGRILGIFQKTPFRFPREVATALAQLCCYRGKLPQGAPTSPVLSNLVCRALDRQLYKLAKALGCKYTRYVDDITFSSREPLLPSHLVVDSFSDPPVLSENLLAVIAANGFRVAPSKTRCRNQRQSQLVTGLVVNKKPNIARRELQRTRAILHNWRRSGDAAAEDSFLKHDARQRRGKSPSVRLHLAGKLNFIQMVRGHSDPIYSRMSIEYAQLTQTRSLKLDGASALLPALAAHAVWWIQGIDTQGHVVVEGSAFSLHGFGVLTSQHLRDAGDALGAASWQALSAVPPFVTVSVLTWIEDKPADVARLKIPTFLGCSFTSAASATCKVLDRVQIIAFRRGLSPPNSPLVVATSIAAIQNIGGISHFAVAAPIYEGMSGGVVLNADGRVLGMVRYGFQEANWPNACVSSANFNRLFN